MCGSNFTNFIGFNTDLTLPAVLEIMSRIKKHSMDSIGNIGNIIYLLYSKICMHSLYSHTFKVDDYKENSN